MSKVLSLIFCCLLQIIPMSAIAYNHEFKEYGIALIPKNKCLKKAETLNVKASEFLGYKPEFNVANHWHVTLFQGVFRDTDIEKITERLRNLPSASPVNITYGRIYSTDDRWIDWEVYETDLINKYHLHAIHSASSFKQKPLQRVLDVYERLTFEQRLQVDNYGTYGILDLYHPHTTILYAMDRQPHLKEIAKSMAKFADDDVTCKAEYMVIGELGYNGNMTHIVHKIDLP